MTTNEITAVRDSLMELIGKGVEKATPLCAEIVNEYSRRGEVMCLVSCGCFALFLITAIIAWKKEDDESGNAMFIFGTILSVSGMVIALISALTWLPDWVAPICGILRK